MALSFLKLFAPTLITNAAATVYTMPSSPTGTVLRNGRVRLTNFDTTARAVTLYAVPSGGSASTTNEFLPAVGIAPGAFLDVDVPQLSVGDFIQALADVTNKVNIQSLDGVLQS